MIPCLIMGWSDSSPSSTIPAPRDMAAVDRHSRYPLRRKETRGWALFTWDRFLHTSVSAVLPPPFQRPRSPTEACWKAQDHYTIRGDEQQDACSRGSRGDVTAQWSPQLWAPSLDICRRTSCCQLQLDSNPGVPSGEDTNLARLLRCATDSRRHTGKRCDLLCVHVYSAFFSWPQDCKFNNRERSHLKYSLFVGLHPFPRVTLANDTLQWTYPVYKITASA